MPHRTSFHFYPWHNDNSATQQGIKIHLMLVCVCLLSLSCPRGIQAIQTHGMPKAMMLLKVAQAP